jgi:hypothetical protein
VEILLSQRDIEEIVVNKNPFVKHFIYPRLFVVNPNGYAIEFLTQDYADTIIKH